MTAQIQTGTNDFTTAVSNSATTLACNKPTNTANGDLLLAYALFRNTAATLTAPSGWTLIGTQESAVFTEAVYYKPIPSASAETATSYTFSTSSTTGRVAIAIARVTGANLASPIQVAGSWATGAAGTVTMAAITATAAGLLVAAASRNFSDTTAGTVTWGGSLATAVRAVGGTTAVSEIFLAQQTVALGSTGSRTAVLSPQSATAGMMFVVRSANVAPTANAGTDQSLVTPGATITLNGTGSTDPEGDSLTYAWTQVSGSAVTLSSSTAASPTFTAPSGPVTLVFGLTVTDSWSAASSQDTVQVTVASSNTAPSISANKSAYDAGETITVTVSDSDGTIASVVPSGTSPLPTMSGSGGTRTCKSPPLKTAGSLTFTATDDDGATSTVTVTINKSYINTYFNGTVVAAYMVIA